MFSVRTWLGEQLGCGTDELRLVRFSPPDTGVFESWMFRRERQRIVGAVVITATSSARARLLIGVWDHDGQATTRIEAGVDVEW